MGGKSGGDAKMIITQYYLSVHMGICHGPVDAVKALWFGEKEAWRGSITDNTSRVVMKPHLFGGKKKEGGVAGTVDFLLGKANQKITQKLAERMGLSSVNDSPGYRGITSLFFHGTVPDDLSIAWMRVFLGEMKGGYGSWYWGTQPYLKPVWVTVQRIPARTLSPQTAPIPRGSNKLPTSIYFEIDDSGSMGGTKNTNMKTAMNLVLDQIARQVGDGQRIDIGISQFNGGKIERPRATLSDITDIRNFVDAIPASGGTPFDAPIADAVAWFEASQNDPEMVHRINFFITDGAPSGTSDDAAATLASDLLDRTIPVDMWGVNIDLQDTSATAKLHNMESDVPVVSGGNASELASIISATLLDVFDANPAHVIYECLTNTDWGMGADPESVDEASFIAASETLYDELFGVFLQWQAQSSIEDFINNVLEHIKGALYPNPRTGKITLRLLRDDLDTDNLKEITPDNAAMANFSRKGWGETTNEIVVSWTNPETEKEETVRIQDLANVAQQGGVVSGSKNYHGIRTASLAIQVAERDLREESAPLSSCEVEVNREFWDVTPFDGIKVTWPEYGLNSLVMRVTKVNYGDSQNSTIKLSLVEDVFSLPLASYVPPAEGEWQDPAVPPVPVNQARLLPVPAYVLSQGGIDPASLVYPGTAMVPLPDNPTTSSAARYDLMEEVATPSGDTVFEEISADRAFPGKATLAAEIVAEAVTTMPALSNLTGAAAAVDETLLFGDASLPADALELALVTAVDGETGALTLLRGVLDTVPQPWPADTPVMILTREVWRLLPREYTDQQSVTLRFLTGTPAGMLEEFEAPDFVGTALARPTKPTRAANVKVNGVGVEGLDDFSATEVLTITWSHRNRLLEDSAMYAWDAASLPLESGVTYRVVIDAYGPDDTLLGAGWRDDAVGTADTWTVDITNPAPPAGTAYFLARVVAERGGETNWQTAELRLPLLLPPYNVFVEGVPLAPPTNISVVGVPLSAPYNVNVEASP